MALFMYLKLGKPMRKQGGMENTLTNKIRDVFTSQVCLMKPAIEKICVHKVIQQFLIESRNIDILIQKGRDFIIAMTELQLKVKSKIATSSAKVEVIGMLWDKILNKFIKDNVANPSLDLQSFISKIMMIRPEVKHACLYKFIQRVKLKYSIAFFQWRHNFVEGVNKPQLLENVETISNNFYRNIKYGQTPTQETCMSSVVSFEME